MSVSLRGLCRGTQALAHAGFSSRCSRAPGHRLSSCGAWASLPRGKWNLSGPGVRPASPALSGGLFTTEPPGKPHTNFLSTGEKGKTCFLFCDFTVMSNVQEENNK